MEAIAGENNLVAPKFRNIFLHILFSIAFCKVIALDIFFLFGISSLLLFLIALSILIALCKYVLAIAIVIALSDFRGSND